MQQRIKSLDVLRGIAVSGVLLRHSHLENVLSHAGWAGVDLFFVLSGYLVSRILFLEYRHTQQINAGRFLTRRALKIYPVFFLMILFSVLFYSIQGVPLEQSKILAELFSVQSYVKGLWNHTWSLAVELHFYLLLAAGLMLLKRSDMASVRTLYVLLLLWMVFSALRWSFAWQHRFEEQTYFTDSHLRFDGLLLGVILSWLSLFSTRFQAVCTKHADVFLLVSIPLVAPLWIWEGGAFEMNTIGLSSISAGFFCLVTAFLHKDYVALTSSFSPAHMVLNVLSYIGVWSYSLYVWHLPVLRLTDSMLVHPHLSFGLYISISLVTAYLSYRCIEQPILRMKDKLA